MTHHWVQGDTKGDPENPGLVCYDESLHNLDKTDWNTKVSTCLMVHDDNSAAWIAHLVEFGNMTPSQ